LDEATPKEYPRCRFGITERRNMRMIEELIKKVKAEKEHYGKTIDTRSLYNIPFNGMPEKYKECERLIEVLEAEKEGRCQAQKTAVAEFLTDDVVIEMPNSEEPASICLIKCSKCGWHMFGDGWWEAEYGNCSSGEQVPRFCAHCGARFADEAEAALTERGLFAPAPKERR
jgi:hypothetical protein